MTDPNIPTKWTPIAILTATGWTPLPNRMSITEAVASSMSGRLLKRERRLPDGKMAMEIKAP